MVKCLQDCGYKTFIIYQNDELSNYENIINKVKE